MSPYRRIYRIFRSVIFSAVITVAALYLIIYVLISVPAVQNKIKDVAQREASKFFGSEVTAERLDIKPFNEVILTGLTVNDLQGRRCLYVKTLGAGINLWRLISKGKIELSYGEIIGLAADIRQPEEGAPLNIDFIIKAFQPKDKNKPPTKFDINLRNIVIRQGEISFNRDWVPAKGNPRLTDFNHLKISDLRGDLLMPQLKNDDFIIDLRRLSFHLSGGLAVDKISVKAHITPHAISVSDLVIQLPGTELRPSDLSLEFDGFNNIAEAFKTGAHQLKIENGKITPSDFASFWAPLDNLRSPVAISLDAEGNLGNISLSRLSLEEENGLSLLAAGDISNPGERDSFTFEVKNFDFSLEEYRADEWLSLIPLKDKRISDVITRSLPLSLNLTANGMPAKGSYDGEVKIVSSCGKIGLKGGGADISGKGGTIDAHLVAEHFNFGKLLDYPQLGEVDAEVNFTGKVHGKDIDGEVTAVVSDLFYNGSQLGGLEIEGRKTGKEIYAAVNMDNDAGMLKLEGSASIDGAGSRLEAGGEIKNFSPSFLGVLPKYAGYTLSSVFNVDLTGNNPDNIIGSVELADFKFSAPGKDSLSLAKLSLRSLLNEEGREISLESDWLDMQLTGDFRLATLPGEVQGILSRCLPSLIKAPAKHGDYQSKADFSLLLHADNSLPEFFHLPFRLLVPVGISGSVDGFASEAKVGVDIPYLQQGKNKLLRDNRLIAQFEGEEGLFSINAATIMPAKKGEMELDLKLWGKQDDVLIDLGWYTPDNPNFKGQVSLDALLSRNDFSVAPEVKVEVKPSIFDVGSARWNIGEAEINYQASTVEVNNLRVWHDRQFVEIDGIASKSPLDSLSVRLADIDLDYIFETLNINYVDFGGIATGEITGKALFSKEPVLSTDNLFVKDLAYNGAVLGDGSIRSYWDNPEKKVAILADIKGKGRQKATVDGGIWITRDSLSFGIDAERIPVDFMAPFMSAFSSEVKGYASGEAKLFGTFSDIDLTGKIYADSLSMKVDYTNTVYHGSDSVYLYPGRIEIPGFRLYDKEGHSALLKGEVNHRYFHDPRFNFRMSDARHLLCYDTNSSLNPDWYGKVYGNGSAVVRGWPGVVAVSVDMNVVGNSNFTFVLNETEAARDYNFLTFSDKSKEKMLAKKDTVPDMLAMFRKKMATQESAPSNFMLDLRATVSPSSLFTLVMDPVAGDKITARGNGALQMEYDTESDRLSMFGKYVLEEGNYKFSLQDLILKDFIIKEGSAISFNGDPMNAMLDITASYRVNTNLSDLDKSFSTDRDLNRTNVPVDALLMVKGEMQQPEITFDIQLPTLTQDVERKVKSIISTDDMMSRQIIYLLALNRFYTPEYMGGSSNGGELAAVASSTLSSQLSNMIGQLTDKFTLAPSIRSDKGDFSDVEFDVALSSRLLNNRLLINGNFGYRDRSTSTTTFVGDFDIEYLLNRSGNLRLKAYNHFNDQNYYLREALTTQGLGVVFRKDFDDAFKWLRPRRKDKAEAADSTVRKDENEMMEK